MATNYQRGLYKDYQRLLLENEKNLQVTRKLKMTESLLEKECALREKLEQELHEERLANEALKKEVRRLQGLINLDGTNSGIPTSQTPIHKKKVVPNSRKKGNRKIGGQPGHAKHKLVAFSDEEINEVQEHTLEACPNCGGTMVQLEQNLCKDEWDYEVIVRKIRHRFPSYQCTQCGKIAHAPVPNHLKEENQYGPRVKALALSLMNIGNVSVNKVKKMLYGLTEEEINPSEGYLIKQQKKAAEALQPFLTALQKRLLEKKVLYWDDTVITINANRGCLRFYGDAHHALYQAHRFKNKEGIDQDQILPLLGTEAIVMHDHNRVNYNASYSFENIECNVHLLRDLQKVTDQLPHQWAKKMKSMLEEMNQKRNAAIERGEDAFPDAVIKDFFDRFDSILLEGLLENKEDQDRYYGDTEQTLLLRIGKYKANYLAWVTNFQLPFSNNLSERALRGVKSKMKISGQFQNEDTAKNYAAVKSYIETCYRNGINETDALIRLCEGTPYTLEELEQHASGV